MPSPNTPISTGKSNIIPASLSNITASNQIDFREGEFNVDTMQQKEIDRAIAELAGHIKDIDRNIDQVVVGMKNERLFMMVSLLIGKHILLEGTPGLGKTLLCKAFAETLGLSFQRIQFTPDLTANDILGFQKPNSSGDFEFQKGPVFANVLLADEINRSPGKTQSALLQAMQEGEVTVDRQTYKLPMPFLVLATQNPLEISSATYPLPDAQLDRFGVKMTVSFPSAEETKEILVRDTSSRTPSIKPLYKEADAMRLFQRGKELIRGVQVNENLLEGVVNFIRSLNPDSNPEIKQKVRFGPSPRGMAALVHYAKGLALLEGRSYVKAEDIHRVALPVLRHRIELRNAEFSELDMQVEELITRNLNRFIEVGKRR